jgi:AcrR family transcriptional regulator
MDSLVRYAGGTIMAATNEPRQERRTFRRHVQDLRSRKLIEVATALMLEKGCSQIRMEDIASECGVAKGTCYRHFQTRSELLAAAVMALDTELARYLISASKVKGEDTHYTAVEAAARTAVDAVIRNLRRRRGSDSQSASGRTWPCCLEFSCCPYGGATMSVAAVSELAREASDHSAEGAQLAIALVMAVPLVLCVGSHRTPGRDPSVRSVQAAALRVLRQLVPPRE